MFSSRLETDLAYLCRISVNLKTLNNYLIWRYQASSMGAQMWHLLDYQVDVIRQFVVYSFFTEVRTKLDIKYAKRFMLKAQIDEYQH